MLKASFKLQKPSNKMATRAGKPYQQIEIHDQEEAMRLLELPMGLAMLSAQDALFSR